VWLCRHEPFHSFANTMHSMNAECADSRVENSTKILGEDLMLASVSNFCQDSAQSHRFGVSATLGPMEVVLRSTTFQAGIPVLSSSWEKRVSTLQAHIGC